MTIEFIYLFILFIYSFIYLFIYYFIWFIYALCKVKIHSNLRQLPNNKFC